MLFAVSTIAHGQIQSLFETGKLLSVEQLAPVEAKMISQDTAAYPGSNGRFSVRIENKTVDTLSFTGDVVFTAPWTIIFSKSEKLIPPGEMRLFTFLANTNSSDTAGTYPLLFLFKEGKSNQTFRVDSKLFLKSNTLIKAYPTEIPLNASLGSSKLARFAVENTGNTTESLQIFLVGPNKTLEQTLRPGELVEVEIPVDIPKFYQQKSMQIGCVVNLLRTGEQVTNIKPVRVYASELNVDKTSNKSELIIGQQGGLANNGYNTVYRSASRIRMTVGQRSSSQFKVDATSLSTISGTRQLNANRVLLSQGYSNKKQQYLVRGGMIAPETPFYARLPRNFVGGQLAFSNKYFESESGALMGYVLSTSDTVQRVVTQNLRLKGDFYEIETKNLAFQSENRLYLLTRNYLTLNPIRTLQIKAGSHFYNRPLPERMAYEVEVTGGNQSIAFGGSYLKTPEVFTPGNSLITMADASISKRSGKNSFSLSGSSFTQGSEFTSSTISRRSFGSFNTIYLTPSLSLYGALMYFESANISPTGTFEMVNRSTDIRINKAYSANTKIGLYYKNQFTDQKINSILNRNEISMVGEFRRGNVNHIFEGSFEQSSFIQRTRLAYQTYFPITKKISFSTVASYNYQPALKIDQYVTTTGELRYVRGANELGLSFNNSFNNNAPDLLSIMGRGAIRFALPRRADRFLKSLEIIVIDDNAQPVPNVLVTTNEDVLITDENGKIRINTLTNDSVAMFVNPRSLPFGSTPMKGLQQTTLVPSKENFVTINLIYTTRILGSAKVIVDSDIKGLSPKFSNYVVKLTNGEETVLRNLDENGGFSASALSTGTWKAELVLKDSNYNVFTVLNPVHTKELNSGDLWELSFIFKENSGKIKIQRGIGR